jgi:hypothetical protein
MLQLGRAQGVFIDIVKRHRAKLSFSGLNYRGAR